MRFDISVDTLRLLLQTVRDHRHAESRNLSRRTQTNLAPLCRLENRRFVCADRRTRPSVTSSPDSNNYCIFVNHSRHAIHESTHLHCVPAPQTFGRLYEIRKSLGQLFQSPNHWAKYIRATIVGPTVPEPLAKCISDKSQGQLRQELQTAGPSVSDRQIIRSIVP